MASEKKLAEYESFLNKVWQELKDKMTDEEFVLANIWLMSERDNPVSSLLGICLCYVRAKMGLEKEQDELQAEINKKAEPQ